MALRACKECKKDISTDANPCPHCGKKSPHGASAVVKYGGGFILTCIALPFFAAVCGGSNRTASVASGGGGDAIAVAQAAVEQVAQELPKRDPNVIEDGTYMVGTEFKPGVYRVGRYWERQNAAQETIANDFTTGCPSALRSRRGCYSGHRLTGGPNLFRGSFCA